MGEYCVPKMRSNKKSLLMPAFSPTIYRPWLQPLPLYLTGYLDFSANVPEGRCTWYYTDLKRRCTHTWSQSKKFPLHFPLKMMKWLRQCVKYIDLPDSFWLQLAFAKLRWLTESPRHCSLAVSRWSVLVVLFPAFLSGTEGVWLQCEWHFRSTRRPNTRPAHAQPSSPFLSTFW